MQPVAYVTRGPIVYCVEDVDNPWANDHFKVGCHIPKEKRTADADSA
jgi:hypothetical protein